MRDKGKNKEKPTITSQTRLGEILEKYPEAAEVLAEKYQLFCVGCFGAAFETLEQGAAAHGMDEKQIKAMIKDLNRLIK
jgi:hybrid cluster-associated redox disulfide protein